MHTVIDMHTHMLSDAWVKSIKENGAPRYSIRQVRGGQEAVHLDGAPFMTLMPGMFDYDMRIRTMDAAGIDLSIITLTCPNVFWGSPEASGAAARGMNEQMADAQSRYNGRIRWMASLPWQHAADAVAELKRAHAAGAVGVITLANIAGAPLIAPQFAPIWAAIEAAGLPVFVHPTVPPGADEMDLTQYNLVASIGFMMDTTLAFTRLILDGFLDRYPRLRLIAPHGGGTLPYLASRLDRCYDQMPPMRAKIGRRPSEYLRRLWYDTVVYSPDALELCMKVAGADRVLFGADYPHNIGDIDGCLARANALPEGSRKAVLGENASKLFGI